MQVDWRGLLDSIRIPWKDRGSNTSANNVNICCPFCGDDRGYHLSIAETKEAYYCYRQPSQHSGKSFAALLYQINGTSRHDVIRLLNRFRAGQRIAAGSERELPQRSRQSLLDQWEQFANASHYPIICDYLSGRGYSDPIRIARRYDLRCSADGSWAARLLLPCKLEGELVSWVGRAVKSSLIPKYLVEAKGERGEGLIYVPDEAPFLRRGSIGLIVEGPLDALRVAAANVPAMAAVALMGKASNIARLSRLGKLLTQCRKIYVCLDSDAGVNEFYAAIKGLQQMGFGLGPISRKPVPSDYKDPGEMPDDAIVQWLGESK